MYVGGFSTAHSVETIIEAANILREQVGSKIRFTIVGGGRAEADYRNLAQTFGLDTVEFRGLVRKDEIPMLLARADVLIASVKKNAVYQFGINFNKLFDYLAAGRPIIFAGESPNDPVKDARAGLTIPPEDPGRLADALLEMLRLPPQARSEMGRRGFLYAKEHFDTTMLAAKLETEFALAISAASHDSPRARNISARRAIGVPCSHNPNHAPRERETEQPH
jgi:glycosyltransferase involved in cell wall biosynthesis